jgi:hypothetical protein
LFKKSAKVVLATVPRGDEPFIRNGIGGNKLVHQPIVCRPAHPLRLGRLLVIRWIATEPQV